MGDNMHDELLRIIRVYGGAPIGTEARDQAEQARMFLEPGVPADKIAIFRRLLRGRDDVYPIRWESRKTGRAGYSPACANEWKAGVCDKPRVKCGECQNRDLLPLDARAISKHLAGKQTIGIYPLLKNNHCFFLAVDFDKESWRDDAKRFALTCAKMGIPVALEISRSGNGAHAWIFFTEQIPAADARKLGAVILNRAGGSMASYDRMFPSQDTLSGKGFGNLIALPLQRLPQQRGASVFVNAELQPYPDQWEFLRTMPTMTRAQLNAILDRAAAALH